MHTHMHTTNTLFTILHISISYPVKPVPLPRPYHKHKPIPVSEFGTHVTQLHENNNQGFRVEYAVSWLNLVSLNLLQII